MSTLSYFHPHRYATLPLALDKQKQLFVVTTDILNTYPPRYASLTRGFPVNAFPVPERTMRPVSRT